MYRMALIGDSFLDCSSQSEEESDNENGPDKQKSDMGTTGMLPPQQVLKGTCMYEM